MRKKLLGYLGGFVGITVFLIFVKFSLGMSWGQVGSLLGTSLTAMTPLVLAAVGESLNEKAGTINIGLEGIFLITALMGVFGAELVGNWMGGLLFGVGVGALIGFMFAVICVYWRGDQIIAGLGLIMFGSGMVPFWLMAIWGQAGQYTPFGEELFVPQISTPLGSLSLLFFAAIGIAILAHFILHRTLIGVKIRAAGEKPESADVAGISVNQLRLVVCVIGAALAGLGGAFMSLSWVHTVTKEMVAGYGFIALACVVFAGLEPLETLIPAFLFGFGRALTPWANINPAVMNLFPGASYFIKMAPFILVLVAIAIVGRRLFPSAMGEPYVRE